MRQPRVSRLRTKIGFGSGVAVRLRRFRGRLKVDFDVVPNGTDLEAWDGKTIAILRSKTGSDIELPSMCTAGHDGALEGTFTQRITGVGAKIFQRVDSLADAEQADIDAVDLYTEAVAMGKVIYFRHFLVGQSRALISSGRRWIGGLRSSGCFSCGSAKGAELVGVWPSGARLSLYSFSREAARWGVSRNLSPADWRKQLANLDDCACPW